MRTELLLSIRLTIVSILVCCVAYPLGVQGVARAVSPAAAEGSLIRQPDGQVIGSRLLAQAFKSPRYLWPRPSVVDYNGAGAGGSNLSPAGEKLRIAVQERASTLRLERGAALPRELLTASGSGLDPHLTLPGAMAQTARIAAARRLPAARVEELLRQQSQPIPLEGERLVNVLEVNLALDQLR